MAAAPAFGRKLGFMFGHGGGNEHNVRRSQALAAQLRRIGIHDDQAGHTPIRDAWLNAYHDPHNIVENQPSGRIIKESLLSGPGGFLKMQTVRDEHRLITIYLFGA